MTAATAAAPTSAATGRRRLLYHLAAGLGLRLFLGWVWNGSFDIYTLLHFVQSYERDGLWALYGTGDRLYHFSPAVVWMYRTVVVVFYGHLGLPLQLAMKLPSIAGDLLTVALLLWYTRRHGGGHGPALWFWWSPVSIIITTYHGNFDALHTAFLVLAVVGLSAGQAAAGGLAWGMAIILKKAPLLWGVALVSASRRQAWPGLLGSGLGLTALAFGLTLALAPDPSLIVRNFTYSAGGYGGTWGLGALASLLGPAAGPFRHALGEHAAKAIIVTSLLLIPVLRRLDLARAVLLQMVVFYLLTVGFGLQYLCWALPFMALAGRSVARGYNLLGGAFVAVSYLQSGAGAVSSGLCFKSNPWNELHRSLLGPIHEVFLTDAYSLFMTASGLALWAWLGHLAWRLCRGAAVTEPAEDPNEEPAPATVSMLELLAR